MTASTAMSDKLTSYKDSTTVPPTGFKYFELGCSTGADSAQQEIASSYGPEELAHRGKMVYERGLFYPMHIGDVLVHRYLVLDKLGFGSKSNASLSRCFLSTTEANFGYSFFNSLVGS